MSTEPKSGTIPTYFAQVPKQWDNQSRLLAKELHNGEKYGGYAYGAYGFFDGVNLALTMPKLVFEELYSDSNFSSSTLWHNWMATPEGATVMIAESLVLIGLSTFGSMFNDDDENKTKAYMAYFWPYVRDVLKALKWAYKGVRNTMLAAIQLFGKEDLRALILPLGLSLGILSLLNRIWQRWMKEERKSMMKANALLHAEISATNCSIHQLSERPDKTDKTFLNSYIFIKNTCGILRLDTTPTLANLEQLLGDLDAAYIRTKNRLLYVEKRTKKITLISQNKEILDQFDAQTFNQIPLLNTDLTRINNITGHKHPLTPTELVYMDAAGIHDINIRDINEFNSALSHQLAVKLREVMEWKLKTILSTSDQIKLEFCTQPPVQDYFLFKNKTYIYIVETQKLIYINEAGEQEFSPLISKAFEKELQRVKKNKNLIGLSPDEINELVKLHEEKPSDPRQIGLTLNEWQTFKNRIEDSHCLTLQTLTDEIIDDKKLSKDSPVLIKAKDAYYLYGNTNGRDWKLTHLDARIIEQMGLAFPEAGQTKQLRYDQTYQTIYTHISAKKAHTFIDSFKSQSGSLRARCFISTIVGALSESLYFYMGAMSLGIFIPPAFIAMAILSAVFAITYVITRIYQEYGFQRKLKITETKARLALCFKEIEILMREYESIISNTSVEEGILTKKNDIILQLETQLTLLIQHQNDAYDQTYVSSFFAILEGLQNGIAVQGAITSFMFVVGTICTLLSIPCPPLFIISCAIAGMTSLLAFTAHALFYYQQHAEQARIIPPKDFESKVKECIKSIKSTTDNIFAPISPIIKDYSIDDNPQFYIVEWCENIRQMCNGLTKGEKMLGEFTGAGKELEETPMLYTFIGVNALCVSFAFFLRSLAKYFGQDDISSAPEKSSIPEPRLVSSKLNSFPSNAYTTSASTSVQSSPSPTSSGLAFFPSSSNNSSNSSDLTALSYSLFFKP